MRQILKKSRSHFFAAGKFRKIFACLALGFFGLLGACDSSTGSSDAGAGTSGTGVTSLYGTWMLVDSSFVRTSAGDTQSIDRDTVFFVLAADGKFAEIKHAWIRSVAYGFVQHKFDTSVGTWGAAEGKLTSATVSSTDSADIGASGTMSYFVSGLKLTLTGVSNGTAYSQVYTQYSSQTTIPTIFGKSGSGSLVTSGVPSVTTAIYVSGYAASDTAIALSANTTYHLMGSVKNVANWIWTVIRASDNAMVDTLVVSAPNGSGASDIGSGINSKQIQFTPTAKWGPTGIYYIKGALIGTDGSVLMTQIRIKAATGSNTTTALTMNSTLSVGGSMVPQPSFIGLGTGTAYTASQTSTNYASIDLMVATDVSGYAIFESTSLAIANGDLSSAYWGSGKATLIAKVTSVPTTLEAAKAVPLSAQSAFIVDGGVYVAKSVEGVYYVLKASNVSGAGDEMTLTVTILK